MAGSGAKLFVDRKLRQRKVVMFTKKQDPCCKQMRMLMEEYKLPVQNYEVIEIESRQDCTQIENYFQIICMTDTRSVPQLFAGGNYIGGEKEIPRYHESGRLRELLGGVAAFHTD